MAKRLLTIFVISAIICGGYFLYMTKGDYNANAGEAATSDLGQTSFELVDQNGKKVTEKDLRGKKSLVFFGFSSCPDVCPVSLAVITEVMNQLEAEGVKNIKPVFITVDPQRDTPAALKTYLKDYHPSFIGLTGKPEELEKVEKSYKVFAEKADAKKLDKNYTVGHSDLIYYMDENGKYLYHFNHDSAPEDIVDYITSH